nr:UvrD-helicase domain-containing protein [Maliibacterium massiliense]
MDLSQLNAMQREAVMQTDGALLVLAGAGSGKTRVLTHRIAHLIADEGVAPYHILAVTFTNKAAREMRERLETLVEGGRDVWCSTFHALCVRILRREAQHIGYTSSFTIYDEEDTGKLLQRCMEQVGVGGDNYPLRLVRSHISKAKDKMLSPEAYAKGCDDWRIEKITQVFALYEKHLKENNAMDFDDLILNTLTLFADHPDVLSAYSARFRYIHVDEYQDTNMAQYMLVKLLAGYHGNICVVGDDDQSIYGWRGADIRNILEFEKDFPGAHVVRLEQNYRSCGNILDAANDVIANNRSRKQKRLWTDKGDGDKIHVLSLADEHAEARYVAGEITRLVQEDNFRYSEIAVLYRTHAQSRLLGNALVTNNIPYRVYGGTSFYQRREIKDALAYLRVLVNMNDEISLARILNVPKRGIGDVALEHIRALANRQDIPWIVAILDFESLSDAPTRIVRPIAQFAALLRQLMAEREMLPLGEFVAQMIEESGLARQYGGETDEDRTRRENLRELVGAANEFVQQCEGEATLEEWLDVISLETSSDGLEEGDSAVTMMTVHGAKGLEFPVVFITGMEEGVFPHARSIESESQMEEERRLCYVGITRAMQCLYITHTYQRTLMNNTSCNPPSRFLREMPQEILDSFAEPRRYQESNFVSSSQQRARASSNRISMWDKAVTDAQAGAHSAAHTPSAPHAQDAGVSLCVGDKVRHASFGQGTVIATKGDLVSVAFDGRGIKQLVKSLARLDKV